MIRENYILLVDNHTKRLTELLNYLLIRSYPVKLVSSAEDALIFQENNEVSIVISQAMLLDSDITELEISLRKNRFKGQIVAVLDDPLAEKAVKALNREYRNRIKNLDFVEEIEKLIISLYNNYNKMTLEKHPLINWHEKYAVIIPSSSEFIDPFINYLLDKISFLEPSPQEVNALRMSLTEALANAIEHGNKFNLQKNVKVNFELSPRKIRITVEDEGTGIRDKQNSAKQLNDEYSVRGRGLLIIKKFMDKVTFGRTSNKIIMVKNFRKENSEHGNRTELKRKTSFAER